MKYFNRKIVLSNAILSVLLLSGCASTSGPTSNVGIVNGKYAVQTTIPNNNKGKKVNLVGGQIYSCQDSMLNNKTGKLVKYTFDLKISEDGKNMIWYNDKYDGATSETSYIGKLVYKPGLGHVETTKGKTALLSSTNNSGDILHFASVNDLKKFNKLNQRFSNGEMTSEEYKKAMIKQNIRAHKFSCTQITNNTITHTRYLTNDEIDMYKHKQQIAVQQEAIDSANFNASMARLQAQNAQMNYNTQQMLNRMNTYNVNVVGY